MNFPLLWSCAVALIVLSLPDYDSAASSLEIPPVVERSPHRIESAHLIALREIGGMTGTGLSVSPDGRYLAFEMHQADTANNGYRVAWFVASTSPGGVAVNVAGGGDPTLFRRSLPDGRPVGTWVGEYARWSPDSRGIAYRKKVNGETQVWWSARDGEEEEQLTHSAADVEEFRWSPDGSRIFFTTDADRAALREAENDRFRNGHVFGLDKGWSTIDGAPLYPPYLLTGGEARVWVLDIESGVERLATVGERREYDQLKEPIRQLERSPRARVSASTKDNSAIAWIQPDDPDKQGSIPPQTVYASRVSDGGKTIRCMAVECTGVFDYYSPLREGLQWTTDMDEIIFARAEGAAYSIRTLYSWRVGDDDVRKIVSTDEWLTDCSIIRGRAVCFRESPRSPRAIVSIDLADGSIETLVDPNPEFQNLIIGDIELIEWKNALGYKAFGYLVKPPEYVPERRYPLVFVGYRARHALRGGTGDEYPVHVLAANGFVVLVYEKPTPYGAYESDSGLLDRGRARWGPDLFDVRMPLESFKSAIELLAERGLVDPARVGVTGLSNGTGHVNYSLIHSNVFAAAITSSSEFGPNKGALTGSWSERLIQYSRVIGMGTYPGPYGFLFPQMSLALNSERINAPLLINVGDAEHPWALEEVIALKKEDKPVEMIVYPDEGHIKWHPTHRLSVYERNVDWFNFWLRGVEDSNPEKVPQYARWRELRGMQAYHNTERTKKDRAN